MEKIKLEIIEPHLYKKFCQRWETWMDCNYPEGFKITKRNIKDLMARRGFLESESIGQAVSLLLGTNKNLKELLTDWDSNFNWFGQDYKNMMKLALYVLKNQKLDKKIFQKFNIACNI